MTTKTKTKIKEQLGYKNDKTTKNDMRHLYDQKSINKRINVV